MYPALNSGWREQVTLLFRRLPQCRCLDGEDFCREINLPYRDGSFFVVLQTSRKQTAKVLVKLFQKLAVSKGSAFGRFPQETESL
ncbi:MAG TPA: hypothetical protein IAC82_03485 [Candidatus Merdivicinus intestinigallinarum]|nr:hypothetical protein [Candidatus Merdivicinus intestinigallinarum]